MAKIRKNPPLFVLNCFWKTQIYKNIVDSVYIYEEVSLILNINLCECEKSAQATRLIEEINQRNVANYKKFDLNFRRLVKKISIMYWLPKWNR